MIAKIWPTSSKGQLTGQPMAAKGIRGAKREVAFVNLSTKIKVKKRRNKFTCRNRSRMSSLSYKEPRTRNLFGEKWRSMAM